MLVRLRAAIVVGALTTLLGCSAAALPPTPATPLADVVKATGDHAPATLASVPSTRAAAVADAVASLPRSAAPSGYAVQEVVVGASGSSGTASALVPQGDPTTGEGLYVRRATDAALVVEVPHPRSDASTDRLGTDLYARAEGRHLLVAGALRDAGPDADVAHAPRSTFAAVDRAVVTRGATVVQVHGFSRTNHPGYPDVVLSTGTATPTALVLRLERSLRSAGFSTCVYDGTRCSDLGATTNVQGAHARRVGAQFVHVELERALRTDATVRERVVRALADVLGPTTAGSSALAPTGIRARRVLVRPLV